MRTLSSRLAFYGGWDKDALVAKIVNDEYNDFIVSYSSYDKDEGDPHGHGKRVPYIGWYWRSVDFVNGSIPIGDCGEFVGFMENNKWDYPERDLTKEEVAKVIEMLDRAMEENSKGGWADQVDSSTKAVLAELWDYVTSLKVKP